MNINDLFPTKWLTPADLKGRSVVVTVEHVSMQEVFNPRTRQPNKKLAVAFKGAKKQMLLNKTQAFAMAAVCLSLDTKEWVGHQVQLSVGLAPNKAETIVVSAPPKPHTDNNAGEPPNLPEQDDVSNAGEPNSPEQDNV